MLGLSQKERDVRESDRIFLELEALPKAEITPEQQEKRIELGMRLAGAERAGSPMVPALQKQLRDFINEIEESGSRSRSKREELLQRNANVTRKYSGKANERIDRNLATVNGLYRQNRAGEERNPFTDQITSRLRTNQFELDQIVTKICTYRAEILGMQHRPLRELLTKIEEYTNWFRGLDLEEIDGIPQVVVEKKSPLPKWARDEA